MPSATREELLGELRDHALATARGTGRVVLLTGEAGMGKTTLARQLAADSGRVLWGSCEPLATTRPLLPLHDWARADDGLADALADARPSHELFSASLASLRSPTLAVVEDVHWADDATLDLLTYLGRRLVDMPSLLLVTTRGPEPGSPARATDVVRHLATLPGSVLLEVPPLTLAEVAVIAEGTGQDPSHVHAITAGNAFFVTEVLDNPTEGVPRSVREAVLARAALLNDDARAVLETVAVIPDRAEIDVVYGAADAGPPHLEHCERAGLLVSDGATVAFRHELGREAIEASLPGARRRERHRRVLGALLREPAGREGQIAYQADAAGAHSEAIAFGLLVAHQSAKAGAHRQAAIQLERAHAHLDHAEQADRMRLLEALVEEYQVTGPLDRAVTIAEEAVAVALAPDEHAQALAMLARSHWLVGDGIQARRDIAEAVRAGERAAGSRGQLTALTQSARLHMLTRDFDECLRVGTAAIALAAQLGDDRMHARAINAVGTAAVMTGRADGVALMEDGLERALRAGDDDNAGLIMVNVGSGLGEVRAYAQALDWLGRAVVFCQERDSDVSRDYARSWQARIHLERGDWPAAQVIADALTDSPSQLAQIAALTVRGRLTVRYGRPDAAGLREAYRRAQAIGEVQRTWPAAAGLAEAAHLSGEPLPEEVLGVFEESLAHTTPWGVGELGWHLVRAQVLAPDDPRLAGVPSPYAAQIGGDWQRAAVLWDELGCRYEAALARTETDDRHEIGWAIATLDDLGARRQADRAAARLRELGGVVPRRASRTTAANPFGLTEREIVVLQLLAEGLSNAEVAERAFISVKTAGHHVSAILAKLGVGSRREAAAIFKQM